MPREVTDAEGTTWSCIQAFAGLGNDPAKMEAARVEGRPDHVHVVCTPDGGARSVRVALPVGWDDAASEEEVLAAIRAAMG